MKKLIILLAAALIAANLTGCGKIKLQKKQTGETKTEAVKTDTTQNTTENKTPAAVSPTKELTITQEVNDSVDNAANSSAATSRKIQNNLKSKISKLSGGAVEDPNKKKTKKPKDEL